jgi:hypothetical protein
MPLKRTPTKPRTSKNTSSETIQQCESEPELGEYEEDCGIVTQRATKRRAIGTPPNSGCNDTGILSEMRALFNSLSVQQEMRFKELQSSMQKQNEEIKDSISFLAEKYDVAMNQIQVLQEKRKEDKKRILVLEEKLEFLERKFGSAAIEIRNVPQLISVQNKFEKKEDLIGFIKDLGEVVKVEVSDTDLRDIYRIRSQDSSKSTIVAEFQTAPQKEKLISAIKFFNKGKDINQKLHTGYLKLSGENKPIYVSESLTKNTAKLHTKVREFAKIHNKACWIFRGAIYLRLDDNKRIQIKTEQDLLNIKSNT